MDSTVWMSLCGLRAVILENPSTCICQTSWKNKWWWFGLFMHIFSLKSYYLIKKVRFIRLMCRNCLYVHLSVLVIGSFTSLLGQLFLNLHYTLICIINFWFCFDFHSCDPKIGSEFRIKNLDLFFHNLADWHIISIRFGCILVRPITHSLVFQLLVKWLRCVVKAMNFNRYNKIIIKPMYLKLHRTILDRSLHVTAWRFLLKWSRNEVKDQNFELIYYNSTIITRPTSLSHHTVISNVWLHNRSMWAFSFQFM